MNFRDLSFKDKTLLVSLALTTLLESLIFVWFLNLECTGEFGCLFAAWVLLPGLLIATYLPSGLPTALNFSFIFIENTLIIGLFIAYIALGARYIYSNVR